MKLRLAAPSALWLGLLGAPAVALQSGGPAETVLLDEKVRVAMHHGSGHVGVAVKVNGKGPFLFNLDTGSGNALTVDRRLVRELGLRAKSSVLNNDGSGRNPKRRGLYEVELLELGQARFSGLRAMSDDYAFLTPEGEEPVMGLLGFPLFREVLLSVDYPAGVIELTRGRLSLEDSGGPVFRYGRYVGRPTLGVEVGGTRREFLVDTGHQEGFSFPGALMDELELRGEPELVGQARTVNNTFNMYGATLAGSIRMAGREYEQPFVCFLEIYEHGLVGYQVLRDFRLTFDQRNGLVRFGRPVKPMYRVELPIGD